MSALRFRRLVVLMLALTFALGPVGHAVAMAGMAANAAVGAADMAMPDCDKCSGAPTGETAVICFAQCTVPSAVLPADLPLQAVAFSHSDQPAKSAPLDRYRPPDPDPPRAIVLI